MERFLQPMSEGRASHVRPSQWEASVPKATAEPLRGRASETRRHTPRDASSNQEADHLRGWMGSAQSDGMFAPCPIRSRVPQSGSLDPWGRGRLRVWQAVEKKEKEKKPRLACWRSRLPTGARLVWSIPVLAGVRCVVPGPWCLVLRCGGGFESRHRTSSTRPHEVDRCKNRPLPSARLSLPS